MTLITFDDTPRAMSRWLLLGHLLRGKIYPGRDSIWHSAPYRAKFLARALLHPILTMKWLDYLAQHPLRAPMLCAHRTLPAKLQRPYLSVRHHSRQTLSALCFHYDEVARITYPALRTAMLTPEKTTIAVLSGKNGASYQVVLRAFSLLDKEGEVTLQLNSEEMSLTRLTMTLIQVDGQKTLFIGGLQGPEPHLALQRERIQQATRDCHGLFPKRIVLEAAGCLGELLGATQILAVGNQTHIYHNWRYWRRKKACFHADYDAFWTVLGGQQRPDGLYQLPLQVARKPISEVASKKRAEYQRANNLLADVHQQMQQLIS